MPKIVLPSTPTTMPIIDLGDHVLQGTTSGDVFMVMSDEFNLTIDGSAGNDWLIFNEGAIKFNMNQPAAQITGYGTHTIANVESVVTSNNVQMPGNDVITGNAAQNVIMTYHGNDKIDAGSGNDFILAGSGNDTVTGGKGSDYFFFGDKLSKRTNVDKITDFKHKSDKIALSKYGHDDAGTKFSIFAKAGKAGALKKSAFYEGAKAHDKDDRIIYDKKTGALYYDPDGTGKEAKVQFATLTNKPKSISADDFYIM
jgi:Ca2+-binding RTX toxin-like protein